MMEEDDFGDYLPELEHLESLGVFAGEGAQAHYLGRRFGFPPKAMGGPAAGGFIEFKCGRCGIPINIVISWDELIVAAAGAIPSDPSSGAPWAQVRDSTQGKIFLIPPVVCRCGAPCERAGIERVEAATLQQRGLQKGVLNPAQVQARTQQVQQVLQAQRGMHR